MTRAHERPHAANVIDVWALVHGCGSGQDHPGQDVLARHVMPVRAAGMLLDGGDELVDLFGLLGAELNAARDAGEDHTSGTEAGLAALAVEGAALDLFEPGTPDA